MAELDEEGRDLHPFQTQFAFLAGMARVVFAALALSVLPFVAPKFREAVPLFAIYLVVVGIFQVLIRRQIGGEIRTLLGGVVDVAILTFVVYALGSVNALTASIYSLIGMLNAVVASAFVAMSLAVLGIVAYGAILVVEVMKLVPHAPLAPPSMASFAVNHDSAIGAFAVVATQVLASTVVVVLLMRKLRRNEWELIEANTRLGQMSQRDPLTQLYNRRYLYRRMDKDLLAVRRGASMALLLVDLDNFKRINDQQGHQRGDSCLERIGYALSRCVDASDCVARYGGDEFIVVLSDADAARAKDVAQRIIDRIGEMGEEMTYGDSLTASVGIALARKEDGVEQIIRRADDAIRQAKRSGGNQSSVAEAVLFDGYQ